MFVGVLSCNLGIHIFTEENQGRLLLILMLLGAFRINHRSQCRPKEEREGTGRAGGVHEKTGFEFIIHALCAGGALMLKFKPGKRRFHLMMFSFEVLTDG